MIKIRLDFLIVYIFVIVTIAFIATFNDTNEQLLIMAIGSDNVTNSTNSSSNASSTTAGSSHIYRGGQGAGVGGE